MRALHTWRHVAATLALILVPAAALGAAGYFAGVPWARLGADLGLSVWRLAASYAVSLVVGVALALAVGSSPRGERFLPLFDVLQNVPSFALIPLFAAALGFSDGMIVAFAATAIVWPITFYVASALRGAKQEENDAATVFGATGWRRTWDYLLPLSFPAIVTGSIVGVSIGWEAVIGAEIIGNQRGIGSFLNAAGERGQHGLLAAGIVALLVVVFVASRVVWMPLLKQARNYAE